MAQESVSSEAEMSPPLTAVQKLGALVNEHAIEPEDYLPPYVQSAYYRLTEAAPSVSRETIARGLGLVSVAQLSDIESTIVGRFNMRGPKALTSSEAFQQLVIERQEEHRVLAKAQPFITRKPVVFGDEPEPEPEPPPAPKQHAPPTRRPSPRARTTSAKPPKKKTKEDAEEAINASIRTAARMLTERNEDPLLLLKGKPSQQAICYFVVATANADQSVRAAHPKPMEVPGQKQRLLDNLYKAATHILGFAPPPEYRPEPIPGRPGRKGYLREAIQQIDALLAKHKADPADFLKKDNQLEAYRLFADKDQDDDQIREALGLPDYSFDYMKKAIIRELMREGSRLLAFPVPPEPRPPQPPRPPLPSRSIPRPPRSPRPRPRSQPPPQPKGYLREALYQIGDLFRKHRVDPADYLAGGPLVAYRLFTDKTLSEEQIKEVFGLSLDAQLSPRRFSLRNSLLKKAARWLAFPEPPLPPPPEAAESVPTPGPKYISHRSTLKQMDAILRGHDIDPVDLIHDESNPKRARTYIALVATNNSADAIATEVGIDKSYVYFLNRRFIATLADDKAPHILRFAAMESAVPQNETAQPTSLKNRDVWPVPPAGTAAAELNNMLSIKYRPGRLHLIQELAALTGQKELYVERFLDGETHHPPAVFLGPCLDYVRADAAARSRIEMLYEQERQVKIDKQKAGKAQMWANRRAKAEAMKPKEEPEEHLPPTALQQLGALLLQHGLPIEKYVPTDLLAISKILGDTAITRRQLQRDHHLDAGTITAVEAHIIKNVTSALPPQITESDDFRYIEMVREAEAGELKAGIAAPARPTLSQIPEVTSTPYTVWPSGERRKVMQHIDLLLREAGHDPLGILKKHPSTGQDPKLFEKLYPLLVDPHLTTKEIRRKMGFAESHQLTHGMRHTWSALMAALPADVVIDVEEIRHSLKPGPQAVPEKVRSLAGPGRQLSQLRRQLKQERGDEVSIENLSEVIGVSRSALQKFLRDDSHPPSGRLLVPLAHLLGVDKATIKELARMNDAIAAAKYEQAQTGRREKRSKGNR